MSKQRAESPQIIFTELENAQAKTCEPEKLRQRALDGDPNLVNDLINCFRNDIIGFLRKRCGNQRDAEDASQDAFESMLRYIHDYRGENSIKNWLYRLASTACSRMRRGQKNQPQIHDSIDEQNLESVQAIGLQVEAMLEAKLMPLQDAIAQLKSLDRSVLLLRDGEELSTEETAQLLGITTSAVKSRLHRARKELRHWLE
jgi:RNA polymerase sigma-70 factor (ECF subfamily)